MVLELMRAITVAAELWMALHDVRRPPRVDEVEALIGATPVLVVFYAERHGVPISEAFALASHESNFRDWRVSRAGCIGTLQIQPRYYCKNRGDCDSLTQRIETGLTVWKRRRARTPTLREAARAYARGEGGARRNPRAGADYADAYLHIEAHLRRALARNRASSVRAECRVTMCPTLPMRDPWGDVVRAPAASFVPVSSTLLLPNTLLCEVC